MTLETAKAHIPVWEVIANHYGTNSNTSTHVQTLTCTLRDKQSNHNTRIRKQGAVNQKQQGNQSKSYPKTFERLGHATQN